MLTKRTKFQILSMAETKATEMLGANPLSVSDVPVEIQPK